MPFLSAKSYDQIPDGDHPGELSRVEDGPGGTYGPNLKWTWLATLPDGSVAELAAYTSTAFSPSLDPSRESKAYKWARACLGGQTPPRSMDPNVLKGAKVTLRTQIVTIEGVRYSRLMEVLPLPVMAGAAPNADWPPDSAFAAYAAEADAAETEDVPF